MLDRNSCSRSICIKRVSLLVTTEKRKNEEVLASGAASGAAKEASAMLYHIRSKTTDAAKQTLCAQTPKNTNLRTNLQMHKKALLKSNWPVRKWHVFAHSLSFRLTRTFPSSTRSHLALHLLRDATLKTELRIGTGVARPQRSEESGRIKAIRKIISSDEVASASASPSRQKLEEDWRQQCRPGK